MGGWRSLPVARRRQPAALMRAPAGRLLRVWCVRRSCGRSRSGHRERGGGNQRGQQRTGKGKLTGDCSRRSSLPAGGGSSPVTASGGARAGGRLVGLGQRLRGLGQGWEDMRLKCFVGWAVSQKCADTMSGQRIYLFIIFFFSLHGYVSYPRRIGAVSVYDTYRTRDTWPGSRVRVKK